MKLKFNFWTFMLTVLLSFSMCRKAPTTPPTAKSAPPSTTSTTNNAGCATTALIGHWYLDSARYYQNGVITIKPSVAAYDYNLYNIPYGASSQPQLQEDFGVGNTSRTSTFWDVTDIKYSTTGKLFLNSGGTFTSGYIVFLDTHSLVIADNSANVAEGYRYFLHK